MTTPTAAPARSIEQRKEALSRANLIRSKRSVLKRDLKAGRALIADVLLSPPEWLETAKVYDLLISCPKYGRVKSGKLLALVGISPSKTVAGLSARQRHDLVAYFRGLAIARRTFVVTPLPTVAFVAGTPTPFERRVLALAVELGEVNHGNRYTVATALYSNPGAVVRACEQLKEKGLMSLLGAPTDAGREKLEHIGAAA